MTRPNEFKTTDIELAAALMTSGSKPIRIAPGRDLVEFFFCNDDEVQNLTMQYASGTLCLEVRRLANSRGWLYRQVKEIGRTGREVRG
jgi:hypothetical protein